MKSYCSRGNSVGFLSIPNEGLFKGHNGCKSGTESSLSNWRLYLGIVPKRMLLGVLQKAGRKWWKEGEDDDEGRLGLFLETLNVKRLEVHIFIFAITSHAYFA